MKISIDKLILATITGVASLPLVALAQEGGESGSLELIIKIAEAVSFLGFLFATVVFGQTVKKFGKSTLGSIFFYLTIGTGIFVFISLFLKLGSEYFMVPETSFEIMWHLMFYVSFLMYYLGLRSLVGLGNADQSSSQNVTDAGGRKWGVAAMALIAIIFFLPRLVSSIVGGYATSSLSSFGVHHFLAFILAGFVASYLISAKKKLGQIGLSIAGPLVVGVVALSIQHLWELFTESWKVIAVSGVIVETGEKILLVIAGVAISYGAIRLKAFTKG
jgi:hypothetical protein